MYVWKVDKALPVVSSLNRSSRIVIPNKVSQISNAPSVILDGALLISGMLKLTLLKRPMVGARSEKRVSELEEPRMESSLATDDRLLRWLRLAL